MASALTQILASIAAMFSMRVRDGAEMTLWREVRNVIASALTIARVRPEDPIWTGAPKQIRPAAQRRFARIDLPIGVEVAQTDPHRSQVQAIFEVVVIEKRSRT